MRDRKKRAVLVRVNPSEPTDGTGRVCIHLFVRDEAGPIVEPHVLHQRMVDGQPVKGKLDALPTRGRLACDHARTVAPVTRGGVTVVTPRTDDPRAVSCPSCKRSDDYKVLMASLGEAVEQ